MKKIMSIFLIAVLLLGMVSSAFFVRAATGRPLKEMQPGESFTTGMYPQSLVEDEALIAALNTQEITMYTYGYGYGLSNVVGGTVIEQGLDYPKLQGLVDMAYGDVLYGGAKYRKVVVNQMRPKHIDYNESGNSDMCGTYYFKWEPIEWIILEKANNAVSSASEKKIRAISKNILNYSLLNNEINRKGYDCTVREVSQLAFCQADNSAFYNHSLNVKYFSSFYTNPEEKLSAYSDYLSADETGYMAEVSDYALLTGADERFLTAEERAHAFSPWNAFTDSMVTMAGEILDLSTQTQESVSDKSLRPMCDFRGGYVPASPAITAYPAEHTHDYCRYCYAPEALAEEASCKSAEKYYLSCALCAQIGIQTVEAPCNYFEHTPAKIISEQARYQKATQNGNAKYYYTCATCGSVLKDRLFTFSGPCETHEYVPSALDSTASCTSAGYITYYCYNCYNSERIYYTEPLGHDWYHDASTGTITKDAANCTYNRTYYKTYKCKGCNAYNTDYEHYYEEENTINPNAHVFSVIVKQTEPTCTQPGLKEYACCYCGYDKTVAVAALGHDSNGTAQSGYSLISPATCTQDAVYYRTCTRCCKAAEQSYTAVGTALGHHYTKKDMKAAALRTPQSATEPATYYYSCINCGEVLRDDEKYFSEEDYLPYLRNQVEAGGTVCFGSWPQSAVTDEALLSRLNEQAVTMQSYKYRYTSTYGSYYNYVNMRYGDVTLDGERYRKVTIGSYRSADLLTVPGVQGIHYQELNNYTQGGTYWFKWEPLVWRVQRIENDKAVLVCENVIDARNYLEDYSLLYNTTWSNSTLRQWLNDSFYESAFNDSEQEQVLSGELYTLDNFAYGTSGGAVTQDKIFVPALEDMQDVSLSINLPAAGTDYALAQGLCTVNAAAVPWVSRTPSYNQSNLVYVNASGAAAEDEAGSISAVWGVRPMLRVSLLAGYKSEDVNEDGVVDLADISLLLQYFGAQSGFDTKWDINDNACIDIGDVSMILRSGYYGKKR